MKKEKEAPKKELPVKEWINQYKQQFERYQNYCEANDWTLDVGLYPIQKSIATIIMSRLKYFLDKFEAYLEFSYVQNFVSLMLEPISLYLDRCNYYFNVNDWTLIENKTTQIDEMQFQAEVMSDFNKIKDLLQASNLDKEVLSLDLPIHSDKKIPFLMKDMMEERYPQIIEFRKNWEEEKAKGEALKGATGGGTIYDVANSSEMFINIAKPPPYDIKKHYYEQSKEVLDFYAEELKKIREGITINGVFIHPLLYWHINFFKTDIPMSSLEGTSRYVPHQKRLITNPSFRDNEWFFMEMYKEAERQKKGLFMFGARRFAKALKWDEEILYSDGTWKPISEAKVKDEIIGGNGQKTSILGVYPQGKIDLYKVTFSDGREVVCCDQHLWRVHTVDNPKWRTVSLHKIMECKDKYVIPVSKPINYTTPKLKEFDFEGFTREIYLLGCGIPPSCYIWNIEDRRELLTQFLGLGLVEEIFIHQSKTLLNSVYRLAVELGYSVIREANKLIISKEEELSFSTITYYGQDLAYCIKVDNEDQTFLTTNSIVTHNTVLEASLLTWSSTIYANAMGVVISGDAGDLQVLARALDIGFNKVIPAFSLPRNNNDWTKHIQCGLKDKAGTKILYSDIFIRNVNEGKSRSSEKTAGTTPTAWIVDEAGKFDCMATYSASLPAFKNLVPVLVGTGGNKILSADAQAMLKNPEAFDLLTMNWEKLEGYVGNKELVTWKRRSFGIFLPAQMSAKPGLSKKTRSLAQFLQVDGEELEKIDIKVTDWEASLKVIKRDRSLKKDNKEALNKERMYFPLDPLECFLHRIDNPFCAAEAQAHKDNLIAQGLTGKPVEIFRKDGVSQLGYAFSDKELAQYPFEGGNIDAPVLMFEEPPEDNTIDGTYVAGLDHYKLDKASTDSVGVLTIYKRAVNLDEWSNRLVATYSSRPDKIDTFNETAEMLLEGYGAECLQENIDVSLQLYLRAKNKESLLLANGLEMVRAKINPRAEQNNEIGIPPTVKNKQYLLGLVINYCNEMLEEVDSEGNLKQIRGVTRIPDIYLLEEIINFNYSGNFDRIVSFGHALAWARYLDSLNIMPKVKVDKSSSTYKKQLKKNVLSLSSPFSNIRYSPYKK